MDYKPVKIIPASPEVVKAVQTANQATEKAKQTVQRELKKIDSTLNKDLYKHQKVALVVGNIAGVVMQETVDNYFDNWQKRRAEDALNFVIYEIEPYE